uniref:Transmembrane protein 234 n=1 Tax=Strigamia maritima TaxID=126957 RepID=T1JIB5_STRMM
MVTLETIFNLILVGCIWGVTNPLMKRGSIGIENIHQSNTCLQFLAEVKFLLFSWKYMLPFLINLSGSVVYLISLGHTVYN